MALETGTVVEIGSEVADIELSVMWLSSERERGRKGNTFGQDSFNQYREFGGTVLCLQEFTRIEDAGLDRERTASLHQRYVI
jgi:hypothetical protein